MTSLPKKILIVTGKAGYGHMSVARALSYWLTKWGYDCTLFDALPAYNDKITDILYKSPRSYKSLFKASNNDRVAKMLVAQVNLKSEKTIIKHIPDLADYDLLISTHALIHPLVAKRRLMVLLDPVVHAAYLVEPKMDYYFSFWEFGAGKEMMKVDGKLLMYPGPLARAKFYEIGRSIKTNKDKVWHKGVLGIKHKKLVLVIAGGKWMYRATDYLSGLKKQFAKENVVFAFVCGKNEIFYKTMSRRYRKYSNFMFLSWLNEAEMAGWVAAADYCLAFSIAQMTIEAGLCQTPIVIADFIPGQEEGYRDVLVKKKVAVLLKGSPEQKIRKLKVIVDQNNHFVFKTNKTWQDYLLAAPYRWRRDIYRILANDYLDKHTQTKRPWWQFWQ